MDHLIGQRFNLISKSEIRYFGTLHEINPEQSTIALEDVYSFGTEGREASADKFVSASQQKFDYIVFRGSDVKDIKIAEEEKENKAPEPQNVLNDPAIVNASRPGPPQRPGHGPPSQNRGHSPFSPPGYPQPHQFGGYYPPQQYGRGYGPPPTNFGPGPGYNMPYGPPPPPPPPGYFGPGGQPFPQGPPLQSPPQVPLGPPGQRPPGQRPPGQRLPGPPGQQTPAPAPPPAAVGPTQPVKQTSELPVNDKAISKATTKSSTPPPSQSAPTPPVQSKPTVSEALAPTLQATDAPTPISTAAKPSVSGTKSNKVAPAVPFTVNQKTFTPPASTAPNGPLASIGNVQQASKPGPSATAMEEASRQAKEAVAAAMAKLNPQAAQVKAPASSTAMDALTKKVSEMRTTETSARGSRGGMRGQRANHRGGGGGGGYSRKMDIPKSDYDFESANAKFNKEDLIKEAIASGSPLGESPGNVGDGKEGGPTPATTNGESRKDSVSGTSTTQAYNKSTSFFDNISSEIKDREEERAQPRGRAWRGEEIKKNLETFGQGSVDGGSFRARGRAFRGRGRPYGGQHRGLAGRGGYGGGSRGQSSNGPEFAQP